jgi:hypothetical protein
MSGPPEAARPAPDGGLARLHLRTGVLRLARVELEELAGDGRLEADGYLDLAEARWRTGDLRGAAEAARAWLEVGAGVAAAEAPGDALESHPAGGDEATGRARALAHALIADGLTVRGRHDDAAIHVAATLGALPAGPDGSVASALDALFAGIPPRADAWPSFGSGDAGSAPAEAVTSPGPAPAAAGRAPGTRFFIPPIDPGARDLLAAADERLHAGDDAAAAVLLVLSLRVTPSRAAEVLERADAALIERPGAALSLARAEALRALGRHEAAGIAYAVAGARARGGAPVPPPVAGADALDSTSVPGTALDAAAVPDPERSPQ